MLQVVGTSTGKFKFWSRIRPNRDTVTRTRYKGCHVRGYRGDIEKCFDSIPHKVILTLNRKM
jgi:retron-type reverse transcriptase